MFGNKQPPAHPSMFPSPGESCSEAGRAIGAGRQPLGWGTSGEAASSGFSFHLAGKGQCHGAAQPQRALSALFAAPSSLPAPPGASLCAFAEL